MANSSSVRDREIMVKIAKDLDDYEEQRMKNPYYRAEKEREMSLMELKVKISIENHINPPYSESDFWQYVLFFAIVFVLPTVCWIFYLGF